MNRKSFAARCRNQGTVAIGMPASFVQADEGARGNSSLDIERLAPPSRPSGIGTLLVPLDGSLLAEHALPHALAIARRTGATIRLVQVFSSLDAIDDPWRLHFEHDPAAPLLQQKQAYLNAVARRIGSDGHVRIVAIVADDRDVARCLASIAATADLVVMASHLRGWWGRLWHGSVVDAFVRYTSSPLMIVRGTETVVDLAADPLVRHILLPLDGSKCAEQIIAPAARIGQLGAAQLTLLHVHNPGSGGAKLTQGIALEYLAAAALYAQGHGRDVRTRVVSSDDRTARTVVQFAADHKADLIALTTHGRSPLSRFARGSVASAVIRSTETPVLVMRPKGQCAGVGS